MRSGHTGYQFGRSWSPASLSFGVNHMSQLVAEVQTIVLATFNISEEEASVEAQRLAGLAVGWSGEEGAAQIAWVHLVKKELGDKLPWKSEAEHQEWLKERKEWYRAYDFLYGSKHRG